jgi:acetyl-CoA carboxylase biotin carboxyl carrier protein
MKKVIDEAVDLLRVVERFDVEEFEFEAKGMRFHLSRGAAPAPAPAHEAPARPAEPLPAPSSSEPPPPREDDMANMVPITSPMVGMFYRAASPDKPPFVDVGQIVELDQPVCIIEAMKLMNIIKASVRGKIAKVMVENQTPVQANQPLFLVEPL